MKLEIRHDSVVENMSVSCQNSLSHKTTKKNEMVEAENLRHVMIPLMTSVYGKVPRSCPNLRLFWYSWFSFAVCVSMWQQMSPPAYSSSFCPFVLAPALSSPPPLQYFCLANFFLCWLGRHTLSAFLPGCWLCSSITPCLLCFLLPPLHPCSLCLPLWGLSASLLSRLLQLLEQRSFLTLQGYAAGITLPRFSFLSLPSHSALLANPSSQAAAGDKTGARQKDGVSAFNNCIVPFVFFFFKQLKNRASKQDRGEPFSLLHYLPLLILGTECRGGEEGGTRTDFRLPTAAQLSVQPCPEAHKSNTQADI